MDRFTTDILREILRHLTSIDLRSCKQVCKNWQKACWSFALFKSITDKYIPYDWIVCTHVCKDWRQSLWGSVKRLNFSVLHQWKITDQVLTFTSKYCKRLVHADLQGCTSFGYSGLSFLTEHLTSLVYLDLSYCVQITNRELWLLRNLPALRWLNLKACYEVSDEGMEWLGMLGNLEYLSLAYIFRLTEKGIQYLCQLRKLVKLDLRYCSGINDSSLRWLIQLPLVQLDLGWCKNVTKNAVTKLFLRQHTKLRNLYTVGIAESIKLQLPPQEPIQSIV